MSDPVPTGRDARPEAGPARPPRSLFRRLAGQILDTGSAEAERSSAVSPPSSALPGIRIDGPHTPDAGRLPNEAPSEPEIKPGRSPAREKFSREEEEVLRQTGQIAAHLRTERNELERREHTLNEQHSLLDQEWRNARLWVHEFEEEMLERQGQLKAREEELNEKIGACENLVSELEEQERLVLSLRDQVSVERTGLRAAVDRELEIERRTLQQTRIALDEERRALAEEVEKRRREYTELTRALETRLEAERTVSRSEISAQLDADRAVLERERAEWNTRRAAEEQQLHDRRTIEATASQRAQEQLSSQHRREFEELLLAKEASEQSLAAEKQVLDAERQKLGVDRQKFADELSALKQIQLEEIENERARSRNEIETARRELDGVRSRIEDDLKARIDERERSLRDEQQKLESQHREQLDRLVQERNLLENRIRFQQEHLQKARQEVEAAQHELRRQHQADRNDFERREGALLARSRQLDHARSLLDEREQSLLREHGLLAEWRRGLERELQNRSESLAAAQSQFEADCQARPAALARREETLANDARRLESRSQRLDGLRIELEDTHRKTLEMRVAIEEVWAQITQQAGAEAAKRQLAETQHLLEDHWQQTRDGIAKERRELAELQASLQARQSEFEREKQESDRIARERQAAFDEWHLRLDQQSVAFAAREEVLDRQRERWIEERLEVERLIRGLLAQVGHKADSETLPALVLRKIKPRESAGIGQIEPLAPPSQADQ